MSLHSSFNKKEKDEPKLIIRFTTPSDQAKVLQFYKENTHKHVDTRKDELWNERTRNGRVILVTDEQDNIGFSSVAYDYDNTGTVKWIELGSTMNQQDPNKEPHNLIKGITLYPSIVAAQTIHEFLNHTPEDKLIANIFDDNAAVIHMLNKKVGWKFFEPDDTIQGGADSTKGATNPYNDVAGDVWLEATTDTLPHQARMVLDLIDNGSLKGLFNKRSQSHTKLDMSKFSLANEFRAAVEALAHGPVAEHLENNPHMGMKAAREYLENHLKSKIQSNPSCPKP